MGRKLGRGLSPLFGEGTGSPSNTKLPEPWPTSIPSGSLIHPAIWPQQIWAENWGLCPCRGGEVGPHLTQCGQGRGLPACQGTSGSVQPFGHSARTSKTDRQDIQRSDSIGRTVLQTVAQKLSSNRQTCATRCVTPTVLQSVLMSSSKERVRIVALCIGTCASGVKLLQLIVTDHIDGSFKTYHFESRRQTSSDAPVALFTARRNARIANAVLATAIPSVCPSVHPSVRHTPVLCQNDCM